MTFRERGDALPCVRLPALNRILLLEFGKVVILRNGGWKDYLEALGLGASDMIPDPYRSTDVELNVIRAMRR
jgi:hypothetical protein